MDTEQPHAVDVIASGIHDAKNGMFDALARIGAAMQSIRDGEPAAALPRYHRVAGAGAKMPVGTEARGVVCVEKLLEAPHVSAASRLPMIKLMIPHSLVRMPPVAKRNYGPM